MFGSKVELLEKIRLGEDSYLELKDVRFAGGKVRGPRQNDLADELAAFANSRGGLLILGVDDRTREVLGIDTDQLEQVEILVQQSCEQSIRPPLFPMIERLMLADSTGSDRAVLKVEVAPSLFVHQSPSGYFHRLGSSKRPIPPDHLARLFQQRSQSRLIRFDETPVAKASLQELDEPLWRRFTPANAKEDPEHLLSKLAMASRDDAGVWRPTVSGLLLASHQPESYLPGAFVQAVAYAGTNIAPTAEHAYQRDARDITGPLDEQIFGACDFVRKNMQVAAQKTESGGREDLPQFDMLAVFEAVTNAIAHRDYSMPGSKVRLRLFDDRLEIYTPGLLPNTMTTDSLPYRQAARNEAITSLLARCPVERDELAHYRSHIMDKRGEGVPIILQRSRDLSGKEPDYRMADDSELLLIIYAAKFEDH
ncbi:ATP-binding protein [Marinobacter lacisalsi]|uniref:ATP-binding protein n=1 Tax=Marinobacter lacisalsi TaxID=475979 RepID=A0ABV8QJ32_9GAMM